MTLLFFKNNKPDTRMIEYDQAIVRLGLEKAKLDGDIERKKNELKQLNIAHELIRSAVKKDRAFMTREEQIEADKQEAILVDYEKRIQELENLLREKNEQEKNARERLALLSKQLSAVEMELRLAEKASESLPEKLAEIERRRVEAERETKAVLNFLKQYKEEKEELVSETNEFAMRKKELNDELETKNRELFELNEIISILQATNKQGLDLVSSFEGERKRLQEKDEALIRKEKDLFTYEKRVEKRAQELGVDIKMTFK